MDWRNENVMVSGGCGSIGSALARRIVSRKPKKLILLDNNESDLFMLVEELRGAIPIIASIRDKDRIEEVFRRYRPTCVFHAAALKHLVMAEKFPVEAIKTNILGTINLIEASLCYGVKKFVGISTDKAADPTSVMGLSKKIAERLCTLLDGRVGPTRFISVRFGNVLASRGSVVATWKRQLEEGKSLTVTDKRMKRFTLGIHEAAELVLAAASLGKGGETFTFDMGSQVSIEELARLMIKLSGKDLDINYTGAGAGEKYEETLYDPKERETLKKTTHKRIYEIKKEKQWSGPIPSTR